MAAIIIKKHKEAAGAHKKANTECEEDLNVNILPRPSHRIHEGNMEKVRSPNDRFHLIIAYMHP